MQLQQKGIIDFRDTQSQLGSSQGSFAGLSSLTFTSSSAGQLSPDSQREDEGGQAGQGGIGWDPILHHEKIDNTLYMVYVAQVRESTRDGYQPNEHNRIKIYASFDTPSL